MTLSPWRTLQNVIQTQKCEPCQLNIPTTPFFAGGFPPDTASSTRREAQAWPHRLNVHFLPRLIKCMDGCFPAALGRQSTWVHIQHFLTQFLLEIDLSFDHQNQIVGSLKQSHYIPLANICIIYPHSHICNPFNLFTGFSLTFVPYINVLQYSGPAHRLATQ